ncbi:MAG: hypothetical protein Q7U02_04405, partial [Desulfosalsimonadaceae bacterium]|nr:hypothetical protein [Desulfosalsimonadaceae bacterium]
MFSFDPVSYLLSCFFISLFDAFLVVDVIAVAVPSGFSDLAPGFVVAAFGDASPGHPNIAVSPNVYSFSSHSSAVELVHSVSVGSSIDALSSGVSCNHSASLGEFVYKRRELVGSASSLNDNPAIDTNALPMDATTNRHGRT